MGALTHDLVEALEASDAERALGLFQKHLSRKGDAWDMHLSAFPVAQRVMNPPFINPHLPKMHRIYRELTPFLEKEDVPALIRLELTEFARRPKLEKLPKAALLTSRVVFSDVESSISRQDVEKTAVLMATLYAQEGRADLARRLLLLGSGYLDHSLGHSVSCTAFILLEMMERNDQDPWPALATLADYFCKGRFHAAPTLRPSATPDPDAAITDNILRATSGRGIVNLHHTITVYSMERVRQFFSPEEYSHLIGAWIEFMGEKEEEPIALDSRGAEGVYEYGRFYGMFSRLEAKPATAYLAPMFATPIERRRMGRFLIKSLCDLYQGDYNPHYLTGLGSVLWVLDRFRNQTTISLNALYQYLDFFFDGIRSRK
ncbi:MAG: hypothetical protein JRG73_08020 [Deltaproteobacteria bacterium]|nr:hypothetical protein [Deltaproteobacteria bacterium]